MNACANYYNDVPVLILMIVQVIFRAGRLFVSALLESMAFAAVPVGALKSSKIVKKFKFSQ